MNEMLKPCPFCGGKAVFVDLGVDGDFEDWDVECTECHTVMITPSEDGAVTTKQEAITAWNRRCNQKMLVLNF